MSKESSAHLIKDEHLRREICKRLFLAKTAPLTPNDLLRITTLSINSTKVTTLSGLEHATNFTHLDLYSLTIQDLSPIASLPKLDHLTLKNCIISDLSSLATLHSLHNLRLINCPITDLSPLKSLKHLDDLGVEDCPISDLAPLAALNNLRRISLRYCDFDFPDLSPLAQLTNLTDITIQHCNITDITPLAELYNLSSLYLDKNKIHCLPSKTKFPKLSVLELSHNQITDVSPLTSSLTRFPTNCFLHDNPIQSLRAYSGPPEHLKHLINAIMKPNIEKYFSIKDCRAIFEYLNNPSVASAISALKSSHQVLHVLPQSMSVADLQTVLKTFLANPRVSKRMIHHIIDLKVLGGRELDFIGEYGSPNARRIAMDHTLGTTV